MKNQHWISILRIEKEGQGAQNMGTQATKISEVEGLETH